jgi:hypothetical protein
MGHRKGKDVINLEPAADAGNEGVVLILLTKELTGLEVCLLRDYVYLKKHSVQLVMQVSVWVVGDICLVVRLSQD